MDRRIIMIGGWNDIYKKAKAAGLHLTVIQKKSDIKPEDLAIPDQILSCDIDDPLAYGLAQALHAAAPFDAVVSFQEYGLLNAARIGADFGIAANPLEAVQLTCDKGLMRDHLHAHGITSTPHIMAVDDAKVIDFGNKFGWPIIVKPGAGTGSRQIHKLHSALETAEALAAIAAEFPDTVAIAEKFIDGPEVSVEAMSWDGKHTILGITDKLTTGAPHFVETGHTMPSAMEQGTLDDIERMTVSFLNSIGHLYGPSHTEIIVSPNGPIIVESHTRTGGDRIFEMIELSRGVDMFALTLQGYAGSIPAIEPVKQGGAAIRYLTLPEGKVASVAGIDDARLTPGVVRCDIDLTVGADIKMMDNSGARCGYVLAIGATRDEAVKNVEQAMACIRITVA